VLNIEKALALWKVRESMPSTRTYYHASLIALWKARLGPSTRTYCSIIYRFVFNGSSTVTGMAYRFILVHPHIGFHAFIIALWKARIDAKHKDILSCIYIIAHLLSRFGRREA
jgi:hypothetical protein